MDDCEICRKAYAEETRNPPYAKEPPCSYCPKAKVEK